MTDSSEKTYNTEGGTAQAGTGHDSMELNDAIPVNPEKTICVRLEYEDVKRIPADKAVYDNSGDLVLYKGRIEVARFGSKVKDYWPE